MSTITTLNSADSGATSRPVINTNFANLNTDKLEKGAGVTGNVVTFGASNVLGDSGKVLPAGVVVGTTDTQTLTNKTLTSPTINTPTITTPTISSPVLTVGSDANGDLYTRTGGVFTRLPVGNNGQTLQVVSSLPAWVSVSSPNLYYNYLVDGGALNAYAITPSPSIGAYALGQYFVFKAGSTNTGAATLNVNALGATAIKKNGNLALVANDILVGQAVIVVYDGTNFQLLSPTSSFKALSASGATSKNLADASTTQNIAHGLGVIPKQYRVTGNGSGAALAMSDNGNSLSIYIGANPTTTFQLTSDTGGALSNWQVGVVTADATNIIITWTKNGSPTGTANLTWSALA